MRLFCWGLGVFFIIVALALVAGVVNGVREGGSEALGMVAGGGLIVAVLLGLAALLIRFAIYMERAATTDAPAQSTNDYILCCSECDSSNLVRGPYRARWFRPRTHEIRCLECGHRMPAEKADWQALTIPLLGAPFETKEDRQFIVSNARCPQGKCWSCPSYWWGAWPGSSGSWTILTRIGLRPWPGSHSLACLSRQRGDSAAGCFRPAPGSPPSNRSPRAQKKTVAGGEPATVHQAVSSEYRAWRAAYFGMVHSSVASIPSISQVQVIRL